MDIKGTKTARSIYKKNDSSSSIGTYIYAAQLILAILICLYLSALTLSAHQLHHSLQKISADGVISISTERLGSFSDAKDKLDIIRDEKKKGIIADRKDFSDIYRRIAEKEDEISELHGQAAIANDDNEATQITARAAIEENKLLRIKSDLIDKQCALVQSVIETDNDYVSSLDNLFEQTGFGIIREPLENDNSIQLALAGYISLYDELTRTEQCSFPEIRRLKNYTIPDKQLTQMLAEYRYFSPRDAVIFPFTINIRKAFIQMPRSMLTIVVVLLMGALGGLITLVRALINDSNDAVRVSYKAFLFTPILGAVTGFAIFVLAKAGVLVISDAGTEGGAYLSPFFVSFLGLISGLLSVDALDTMTDIGKKWFSSSKGTERWCVDGGDIISDDEKIGTLAVLAGVPDELFREWLRCEKPVPEYGQKIISAAQTKPQGTIFTDIQPPKTSG